MSSFKNIHIRKDFIAFYSSPLPQQGSISFFNILCQGMSSLTYFNSRILFAALFSLVRTTTLEELIITFYLCK